MGQRERLKAIGLGKRIWQQQVPWERRYAQALALHARLGTYQEQVYLNEDKSLKRWIRRQGHDWDKLSQVRRERLKAIGLRSRTRQKRKN